MVRNVVCVGAAEDVRIVVVRSSVSSAPGLEQQ
jgi:hypothetical protein